MAGSRNHNELDIYSDRDYEGCLNLLKEEKRLIIKAITIKPNLKEASIALEISMRTLSRKLIQHSIKTLKQ